MWQEQQITELILHNMVEGVLAVDYKTNIILANKAAEKIFMVKETDILGHSLFSFQDNTKFCNMVTGVLDSGREVFAEVPLGVRTRLFRVHVSAIIGKNGETMGAVAVIHDVTDARNFDQIRSDFVSNVSHELRTPLTSIKGFVETLLDGALEDAVLCRRFLSIIDAETDRLSRLIEDLLTLSAIESKEQIMQLKPICIVQSIRHVLNVLGLQISEKLLRVNFIYDPNLAFIQVDEDLINQVLINLLDNAVKYTPAGGTITIRCQNINNRVLTTVTDTGMGIPRENLSRIFERFYRVDKSRSRDQGGTGLGLAIVKHIVESHGGEVFVESEPGQGSTFGVSFIAM